jgi:methionyl-tRNA synthetase
MITRYFGGQVPYPSPTEARKPADDEIAEIARRTVGEFSSHFDNFQFSRALEAVWALVGAVNKYLVENEPWTLGEKQDEVSRARLGTILYTSAEALRIVTALVHPVIPDSSSRIWAQLGLGEISGFKLAELKWGQLQLGTKIGKVEPVFPRADKSVIEKMQAMEQQRRTATVDTEKKPAETQAEHPGRAVEVKPAPAPAASAAGATATVPATAAKPGASAAPEGKIGIEDFAKVEMRVGQVKVAEKVKGADKLLRLEVDLGGEVRQVVAGIAEAYAPELLIGRKVVIVANLAPRKLRGLVSDGMIVAASVGDQGKPVLAGFLEDVPVGARLK